MTHELHPGPVEGYDPPPLEPTQNINPIGQITKEEVILAVKSMGLSKSPGPSGLGPAHWRVIIQVPGVPEVLAQAFNEILGSAQKREYRDLYAFRLALIPKDGAAGKYRPVAIGETITMAFHKILLSRLKAQVTGYLEHEQIAFRRNAHAVGVRMAFNAMQKEGTQAVSLDIQNAFNSIPREEILHGLDEAHVPLILRNYIEAFLQLRHAAHLDSVPCGVPQGDPLSMMLYCLGQNAFLRQLKLKHPNLIAYADDVLIFHDNISVDATDIIREASDLARHFGLTVNIDKCKSSQRGQEVTFLGAPVSRERLSIAPKAIANAVEHLKLVMESPISHHAKLTLVRICVVPMANYAPLVEMESPHEPYDSFDMRVGTALAGLLDSDPKKWVEFLAAPKDKGGLGVHLPGVYHKQLRDAFETLDLATGHRDEIAMRSDLQANSGSYANRVLGSLMMLPDDAFRRLAVRCGLGPTIPTDWLLSSSCTLCGTKMSEDHILNCRQTHLYRVMRHAAIVCWLYDHLVSRRSAP